MKSLLMKYVPNSIQHRIKKGYYPFKIKQIVKNNDWEYSNFLDTFVKTGDKVIDIGANIGYIGALLAEKVGNNGSVACMEPIPETFELLSNNISKLGYTNIKALNFGASDENTTATFEIPKNTSGAGENFYQAKFVNGSANDDNVRRLLVDLRKVDSLFCNDNVSFIKIDVEGHELQTLIGAKETLERCKPVLIVEASDKPEDENSETKKIFDYLFSFGYKPYVLHGDILKLQKPRDNPVDYVYLTDNQFAQL